MKLAVVPIGRSTFDLEFATTNYNRLLSILFSCNFDLIYPQEILVDEDTTDSFIERLRQSNFDYLLVVQTTFTDAITISALAESFSEPLTIVAFQEPRMGKRLRLNSFCGLNLASHALGLRDRPFNWLYSKPNSLSKKQLIQILNTQPNDSNLTGKDPIRNQIPPKKNSIEEFRIGLIGNHPPGFDTCAFDADDLKNRFNTTINPIPLVELFETANAVDLNRIRPLQKRLRGMKGYEQANRMEIEKSLKLKIALDHFVEEKSLSGLALRCWPETFTDYGAAICGPASLLGDEGIPCSCEADVFGTLSQLWLRRELNTVTFLVDIVDMDIESNTAVVWHCGQAPLSMCKPEYEPEITIHTNRKKPILFQFPLKEGDITLFRVSQSLDQYRVIVSKAKVIDRPLPYTGTSGTIQFENDIEDVLEEFIHQRIEHHLVLVYGDYAEEINQFSLSHDLPLVTL